MSWDNKYRLLNEGEIVRDTDEVLDDHGIWQKSPNSVGQEAPDPRYTSHRQFRRLISTENPESEVRGDDYE